MEISLCFKAKWTNLDSQDKQWVGLVHPVLVLVIGIDATELHPGAQGKRAQRS